MHYFMYSLCYYQDETSHRIHITDREIGITNAINKVLPNIQVLHCWNHLFRDIAFWVRKHGGNKIDEKFYKDNVRTLMECQTEQEYESLLSEKSQKWSVPFVEYFEAHISPSMVMHAG